MQPILINRKEFVVYFESVGFYAANQKGSYYWVFTPDLTKAKKYKTIEGASLLTDRAVKINAHAVHQKELGNIFGYEKKVCLHSPLIYEIGPNGLTDTTPISPVDVRPKRVKDMEKESIDMDALFQDFKIEDLKSAPEEH